MDLFEAFKDYQHLILAGAGVWAYFKFKSLQDQAQAEAKKVIEERHQAAKDEIHAALANGIGDLIDRKNQEQDQRWTLAMRSEFMAHEAREQNGTKQAVEDALERFQGRSKRRT